MTCFLPPFVASSVDSPQSHPGLSLHDKRPIPCRHHASYILTPFLCDASTWSTKLSPTSNTPARLMSPLLQDCPINSFPSVS